MPQQTPPLIQNPIQTPAARHRQRVMSALCTFAGRLTQLADYLVFRFRSTEAAQTIREYVEQIGDIVTPADARDILGEILQSERGAIKPPQLDQLIRSAIQALFNAMDMGDGLTWPLELMTAQALTNRMFDPYAAARMDLHSFKSPNGRGLYIELGPNVLPPQLPAASHSNSVGVTPSPATSRRVTASRSGKVKTTSGDAAMTA